MLSKSAAIARSPATSLLFKLVSAGLAFMLWGGWAYYVNENATPGAGLLSGMMQGTASFIITLSMVHLVTWFYRHLPVSKITFILPALLTVTMTGSCLIGMHLFIGTPEIINTVLPALSVALAFSLFTTFKLTRQRYQQEQ